MDIIELIKKHGLHIGVKRKLSFYAMTVVAQGYTRELRPWMGFSYEIYGVATEKDQTLSIVNDTDIATKTELFLVQNPDKLQQDIFPRTQGYLSQHKYNLLKLWTN